jgi:hypothetical protein
MNNKHLAALVVVIATIVLVQVVMQVHKHLATIRHDAETARASAEATEAQLRAQRVALDTLQRDSAPLLEYLRAWEPALLTADSPEAGELIISTRIKRSGLVSLAQKYETATLKNGTTIPKVVRADLTFEDDYARTLNWLGETEHDLPASRVSSLRINRGQSGNDIRMEVELDLPLTAQQTTAAQ